MPYLPVDAAAPPEASRLSAAFQELFLAEAAELDAARDLFAALVPDPAEGS